MKRWVIIVIGLCFLISTPLWATDKELYYPPPTEENYYIVQKGDCLSSIAQKLWHDMNRWKDLWELNKWIENPDLIIPGWKLTISEVSILPENYRDFLKKELKQKVFKIRHIEYSPRSDLIQEFNQHRDIITYCNFQQHSPHYVMNVIKNMLVILCPLELHDIIDSIMLATKDDEWHDMATLLVAVAWQEGCFRNHTGKHGEKGYFQMKPETAQIMIPNMDIEELAYSLEFNTGIATQLTYNYLCQLKEERGSWRQALERYNGSGPSAKKYANMVINKFHRLKRMKIN